LGNPQDDSNIYINNDYFVEIYPEKKEKYDTITARVDVSNIDLAIENIEKSLRKSRDLKEGKEDFFVQSFEDLLESFSSSLNIIVGFIILIALISVLVSAINTANTMITSVIERTKEIGVMKSIGARNNEIFGIFLFESSLLGFIAGVIGVILGGILTFIGGSILTSLGWGFLQPHYSFGLFLGCILFATITGAISGVFPAWNASRTNPVEALRYE
jgi:putative ABC transport system permease protein